MSQLCTRGRRVVAAVATATASLAAAALLVLVPDAALAQPRPSAPDATRQAALTAASAAERTTESSTLTFANRPIVVLRARVLGRQPSDRTTGAERLLDDLVEQGITGPVESRDFAQGSVVTVGGRAVFLLTLADVDELAGETLDGVRAQAVVHLRQAMADASDARSPVILIRATLLSLLALIVASLLLWALAIARRRSSARLVAVAERQLERAGIAQIEDLRASRLLDFERRAISTVTAGVALVVVYTTVRFILRRFPYTRPWGESMSGLLLRTAIDLGIGILDSLPGLLTVAFIFVLTRVLARLIALWFNAVEQGRVRPRVIHPETAQPTRRLATTLLWLFAIVVAYPYLPGSGTDAFKGVSVFLGLMLTLGSSGIVNQVMSGFMLTYSRALRLGDFVKIGDVEGTVTHIGVLSTKVRTLKHEEVTIPNAVVVGQTTTNYDRLHEVEGVLTPTSVTIGYDAPWRQIQALLLEAAAKTPGLRRDPKPIVFQTALQDFYVQYTLFVSLEHQESRLITMHTLHANIQDMFNEYGVQIMSPNYLGDPSEPKVVPKARWYAAPAHREISPTTPAEFAPTVSVGSVRTP